MVDLAVFGPVVPEIVGPIAMMQRLHSLLQDGLEAARAISWNAPGSGLRSGLTAVLDHVRELAEHAGDSSQGKPAGGPVPASVPASVPPPAPLPTVPTEQGGGSGSSIGSGSHGHGKGGSAHAVLGGGLLVLFLRPLSVSRRLRSTGYSRSLQPLALPG